MTQDELKKLSAETAANLVQSGMVVGLGTGSTAIHAVRRIADRLNAGELANIVGIPTSLRTKESAEAWGIPLVGFGDIESIDLTIDGADEVDDEFDVIKGGGGALTREKIVAQISRRSIIVVDETKVQNPIGTTWALPIEVVPFGWETQVRYITKLGASPKLRHHPDGSVYLTDQGNYILDSDFGPMQNKLGIAYALDQRAGIVAHGLFLNLTTDVIIGSSTGVKHLRK